MIKIIETNNFLLHYKHKIYKYQKILKNYIIIELYRTNMYNKLHLELNNLIKKYDYVLSIQLAYDILSLLIFNHKFKSKLDPLFDSTSPFTIEKINNLFDNKCITYCDTNQINIIKKEFPQLSKYYLEYYKNIKNNILNLNSVEYELNYEILDKIVNIKLNLINNVYSLKYIKKISIPIHIFFHLISLYNIKILNNYKDKTILDLKVIEYIYILFNRYFLFQSGNNQASILPSFKKLLKEKLNIKIELFGSPLNTSNTTFGSFFYDCEYVFGSIGNFFKTKILKGYYEINPIFDKCIIKKMFDKITKELIYSEKKKFPLLFFFIIPISYFKLNKLPKKLKQFITFKINLEKEKFPYIRYNRTFNKTTVTPIVNTTLLICNTTYISEYVKSNLNDFNNILNQWIKNI
jgi:hypothetical protein